ncbi:transmembrane protein [Mycobacterium tuberculosis]|nr:transmembrane protein [Mycobacterium tuberculosis]CKS58928.1 transmembrane protein [Mycobacterium tuberculosis]CKT60772.1 transmembrane protein [Mycobacterium tuberculosis]
MKVAAPQTAGADEPDYLDVDVVEEDSEALPVGAGAAVGESADEADAEAADGVAGHADPEADPVEYEYEYEYVEDTCGLELEEDDQEAPPTVASGTSRRRRFDTKTAAAVSARKYTFRKRALIVMAVILVGSAAAAFELTPVAWWICGSATGVTVLYLAYLRRQTRIEEKVRRRRMQRIARARLGVENTRDREYDVVPSRLRRPGAVVLEIDDEDPIFTHLESAAPIRNYGWPRDLPRAVGQ